MSSSKVCPGCGTDSPKGEFTLNEVTVAKKIGEFSLPGQQMKFSATTRYLLTHTCGWSVYGHIEDGYFIADKE